MKSSFIIRKLGQFLPKSCLRYLYFAYYHSHLSYCFTAWYPLINKKYQDCLLKLQKRVVCSISNAPYLAHCMPLFKTNRILTLKDQLYLDNVKLMHSIVYNECPITLTNQFDIAVSNRSRMRVPQSRTFKSNMGNKSFLCKPVIDWQNMSASIRKLDNLCTFTRNIKNSLIEKY